MRSLAKPQGVMRYLSVCSGIEAASAAWHPLGMQAAAFSEIEAFPRAVLASHYPDVPLHGDFTTIKGDEYGAVDVLVGGTPCQDFSVAGLRAGLAGERGNLTLEFVRLADRTQPRWIVWENVPGVLSIDGGRAFGAFLGGLAQLGYGFAYRVLDAQYFGLAQRRARVFVVGYLGDWRRAAAVLFEPESLQGNPPPRREAGQGIAPTIAARTKGGGGLGTDFDCDGGLIANTLSAARGAACANAADLETYIPVRSMCLNAGGMGRQDSESETLIAHSLRAEGFDAGEDGTGRGTPIVAHAFDARQSAVIQYGDKTGPLDTNGHSVAIAFSAKDHGADAGEIAPTLRAGGFTKSHANGGVMPAIATSMVEFSHARTHETDTYSALRALRETLGEKAFAEWGLGVLDSLQSPEVLRSEVHGGSVRREADEGRRGMGDGPLSRSKRGSAGALREVRQAGRERRPPHRRELSEQLARELEAALSQLSSEGAQATALLHDLRRASEGIGVLQQALHPIQGRPPSSVARRLTPRECERLMGFPDDYTLVTYRGKPAADGPRYKALGNSMAVPCMRWLGERIQMVEAA